MIALLLAFTLQTAAHNDVAELRKFLGVDYPAAMRLLSPSASVPPALKPGEQIVVLTMANAGRALLPNLFKLDFPVEQVNLVFCSMKPERVIAVQMLFDDRRVGDTVSVLSSVYQLSQPVRFETWQPAVKYPLPGVTYNPSDNHWSLRVGALPVTVWDLGTAEAVYQPVKGASGIRGQLWLGDREVAKACLPASASTSMP